MVHRRKSQNFRYPENIHINNVDILGNLLSLLSGSEQVWLNLLKLFKFHDSFRRLVWNWYALLQKTDFSAWCYKYRRNYFAEQVSDHWLDILAVGWVSKLINTDFRECGQSCIFVRTELTSWKRFLCMLNLFLILLKTTKIWIFMRKGALKPPPSEINSILRAKRSLGSRTRSGRVRWWFSVCITKFYFLLSRK